MNKKHVILIISFICVLTLMIGCNSGEVTPKMIADSIFANVKEISLTYEFPKNRKLDDDEIKLLKDSIKYSTELETITNHEIPAPFQPGYSFFRITKIGRSGASITYDKTNGFLIIPKIHVHQDKIKEYEQKLSLMRKYLEGAYRLRPSKEFDKVINGMLAQ